MNDGKLTILGEMGVSIFRRDSAMCCPSGMGNAKISSHHIEFFTTPNFLNTACIFTNLNSFTIEHRHSAGIITSIFQIGD